MPVDALQALNLQLFVVDCSLLKKELKHPALEDGLDLNPYVLYGVELRAIRDIVNGLYPVVFEEGRDLLAPMDGRITPKPQNTICTESISD